MFLALEILAVFFVFYLLVRLAFYGWYRLVRLRARRSGHPDPDRPAPFEVFAWTLILMAVGTALMILVGG
jgi:hypothetical protein